METGQDRRVPRCSRTYFVGGLASLIPCLVAFILVFFIFSIKAPSISVASASVSAFDVSASSISGVWDVSFDVRDNNNFMTASYEEVQASVYYKDANLSQTSIQPFHEDNRNGTTVRTSLSAVGAHVDASIINAINGERAASGSVDFTVILNAKINYRAIGLVKKSASNHLDATCHKISIALPENSNQGTLVGGSKACARHTGRGRISARGIVFSVGILLVCIVVPFIILGSVWYYQRLASH